MTASFGMQRVEVLLTFLRVSSKNLGTSNLTVRAYKAPFDPGSMIDPQEAFNKVKIIMDQD